MDCSHSLFFTTNVFFINDNRNRTSTYHHIDSNSGSIFHHIQVSSIPNQHEILKGKPG
ncbi:hypothetical protein BC833DRAFT_597550 [Globomyces pollinis-pini]|nr:hypothetical protein BC833DRAFT_597550 [Globomyces pollinis-pini]